MSHQQAQGVPQQQSKSTTAPVAPSMPLPIDPALLGQISGGTDSTSAPTKVW